MALSLVSTGLDRSPQEWHEWRRAGLGASEAGAVCGLSPWSSALAVWLEKTGRTQAGRPDGGKEPDWLYWGRRQEPIMAEEFGQLYSFGVDFAGSWHERPMRPCRWNRTTP